MRIFIYTEYYNVRGELDELELDELELYGLELEELELYGLELDELELDEVNCAVKITCMRKTNTTTKIINGSKTRTHDNDVRPLSHKKFKRNVHNTTNNTLTNKLLVEAFC